MQLRLIGEKVKDVDSTLKHATIPKNIENFITQTCSNNLNVLFKILEKAIPTLQNHLTNAKLSRCMEIGVAK